MHLNSSPVLQCGHISPPSTTYLARRFLCEAFAASAIREGFDRSDLVSAVAASVVRLFALCAGRTPSEHNNEDENVTHEPARAKILTESIISGIHHNIMAEKMPATTHMAYVPAVACVLILVWTFLLWQYGHSGMVAG